MVNPTIDKVRIFNQKIGAFAREWIGGAMWLEPRGFFPCKKYGKFCRAKRAKKRLEMKQPPASRGLFWLQSCLSQDHRKSYFFFFLSASKHSCFFFAFFIASHFAFALFLSAEKAGVASGAATNAARTRTGTIFFSIVRSSQTQKKAPAEMTGDQYWAHDFTFSSTPIRTISEADTSASNHKRIRPVGKGKNGKVYDSGHLDDRCALIYGLYVD